jgi:hypothetical protein
MRTLRNASRLSTAAAVASLTLLTPAGAAYASGTTQVSGLMVWDGGGSCTQDPSGNGAYVVAGGLVGCWYLSTIVLEQQQNSSYRYSGTELFVGCLGEKCGRLHTTFTFTAQYAADGTELHGRCHHPITSGEGGLAGASGVINMHDNPDGSVDYAGHVTLPGDSNARPSRTAASGDNAEASATTC